MQKLFILGVGAQKAGTSWLHRQLVRNASIDMGFSKEYHVFNTVFEKELMEFRTPTKTQNPLQLLNIPSQIQRKINKSRRQSFIEDTNNYFDFFDKLYSKNRSVKAVGDITPSYSILNASAFEHIKQGLEKRGFTVKVVFLMRDPVERVWSMARMKRKKDVKKRGLILTTTEVEDLETLYKLPYCDLNTRYDRTIIELENVFSDENIFYDFYERMFSESSFNKLKKFLDIDLSTPQFNKKFNISPKNEKIPPELLKKIAFYYKPTYDFIEVKFGSEPVSLWGGYKYLNSDI